MSRTPAKDLSPTEQAALDALADEATGPKAYRASMTTLGRGLAARIGELLPADGPVAVVCTPEDADTLAAPMLEALEAAGRSVRLVCFWNERATVAGEKIAPIIRRYVEPAPLEPEAVVVLKSIISGGCVVRTNVLELLHNRAAPPSALVVAAPVARAGARERLLEWLPAQPELALLTLATDTCVEADGTVRPGVGGNVYQRLGWRDQAHKNTHRPALVSERNARWMAAG